jgi:hypothetical protein
VNDDFCTRNSNAVIRYTVVVVDDDEDDNYNDVLSLRLATVRAATANNVRTWLTAIGNERIQAPTKTGRGAQVANRLRHGTGNGRFMQREDAEPGKVADSVRDGPGKEVAIQLQEFHGVKHANLIDAARHLIVIQIKLRQRGETQEFGTQTARQ